MDKKIKLVMEIVLFVAAIAGICTYLFPNTPDAHKSDDIIGTWTSDYSYDNGGIIVRTNGNTSYFSNGKYNVNADMSFQPDSTTIITFAINGAGEWSIHDNELITTLNTLKSTPTNMVYKGKVLRSQDFDILERISNQKIKTIEDFTASGASQSYIIKNDDHDKKLLEGINPFGKNFNIEMYRKK
ncbi:hypothetical protein ACMYSN_20145 [Klebsiella sp. R445]